MILWLLILKRIWPELVAGAVALVLVVSFAVHERHVQRDKDAKVIAALRAQVVADQASFSAWEHAAQQWQAAQAANDSALKAQQAAGQAALAKAKDDAAKHAKALTDALARQKRAYAGNACASQPLPEGVQ